MTDVRGQMSEEFEWGIRKSDKRSQPSRLPEKFSRLGRAAGLIEKETLNNRIPNDE